MTIFSSGRNEKADTAPPEFPLRLGSVDDFARVELMLKVVNFDEASVFDEANVCRILNIERIADLASVKHETVDLAAAGSENLALLIKIFLFLLPVRQEEVKQLIDPVTLSSLHALDLLRVAEFDSGTGDCVKMCFSSVLLYPVAGLLIASDRHTNPDGSPFVPPPDVVFPAIYAGTLRFLRVISKSPITNVLDLCSGSGIAALMLSKHAERAVAADITARAIHFARFNRLLNRCYNVEVIQSDLFSAFEGQTFDRIVAHPPYVPSLSKTAIFRDAGETGEALIRRIIEGLHNHLRPGGTFYSVCAGLDTKDGAFEERTRRWLGESQEESDLIFALSSEMSPDKLARQLAERADSMNNSDIAQWEHIFNNMGVHKQVYGAIVIRRRAQAGGTSLPLTLRCRLSGSTDGTCFEWALRWYSWRARKQATGELSHAISSARPRLASSLQVKVTHAVRNGELVAAEFVLESEKPFEAATKVDPQIASLMAEFNGNRPVAEIYEAACAASMLPEWFTFNDFANLVAGLIERGYLEVDEAMIAN